MTDEQIIQQLVDWHYEVENWIEKKASRMEAWEYSEKLLKQGNIITITDGDILCGYVESWKINFEQWGRIICGEPFFPVNEDIQTGWIAVVGNTFIRPEYRNTQVYKKLRDRFFELNKDCRYFAGEARRKKAGFIKVFKRKEIFQEA